jgi:TBC domain-containing protein kinase-like protein
LTRQAIVKEAREDVPPFCRARVWAALLKVDPSYSAMYAAIDKETSHSSDRQVYSMMFTFHCSFIFIF